MRNEPIYSTHQFKKANENNWPSSRPTIRVARTLDDLMQVTAIRSAVFLTDQVCPYEEEFDGNDLCAIHLIGSVSGEPAACIRARFFADFVKLERLAVRQEFRRSRIAFMMVQAGIELARKKGFRRIYGHAQDRLVDFWARFGAKPLGPGRKLVFSDFSYTEMVIDLDPHPDPITVNSDPYLIIRPEGDWHIPGVLDASSARAPTSPLDGQRQTRTAA